MPFSTEPWARQDAYARLPFDAGRSTASDLHSGGLTFLDVARLNRPINTVARYLDEVPAWLLARPSTILMRWLEEDPPVEEAAAVLENSLRVRGVHAAFGLLVFRLGEFPKIEWGPDSPPKSHSTEGALLQRARRVELASFLHWGGSVWRPTGYHYRFPSGRHSRTFVRLADAFTDVRAAPALATWLFRHLNSEDATAVVVDTGALGPIVTELRAAVASDGGWVGPVIGIDSYPPTALGMQQRIKKQTDGQNVLGLISVSDTGRLADQLDLVLERSGASGSSIEQFVARSRPEASALEPGTTGVLDAWLSLGSSGADPSDPPCEACRDPKSARLVNIDPRSMSAMVLPEPDLLMPDLTDARRNASLWENYEAVGDGVTRAWVGLTGPTQTRPTAPASQLGARSVFFEPAVLVQQGMLATRHDALPNFAARRPDDPEKARVVRALADVGNDASVVVLDETEAGLFDGDDAYADLRAQLAPFLHPTAVLFSCNTQGELAPLVDGTPAPESPSSALIVALGVRSGVTLHRMFLSARQRWPLAQHRGLVVHAHPNDDRVWASARNTFTDTQGRSHLLALWLTYLPQWTPFADELALLEPILVNDLPERVRPTLTERRDALRAGGWLAEPLWGPTGPMLRAGSFLGEHLRAQATVVSVGAALQSARLRARSVDGSHSAVIDLPRSFRSFFDGLIHVAILRWCQPNESWWGPSPDDCIQLISEMSHQMQDDWMLILPELVLASLQGKLPAGAIEEVMASARLALDGGAFTDARAEHFLDLGLELWEVTRDE